MDCVHFNPVRHGLVAAPEEWRYSTFKACVRRGLYPPDWIGSGELSPGEPRGRKTFVGIRLKAIPSYAI
jgi:hypothetical protein